MTDELDNEDVYGIGGAKCECDTPEHHTPQPDTTYREQKQFVKDNPLPTEPDTTDDDFGLVSTTEYKPTAPAETPPTSNSIRDIFVQYGYPKITEAELKLIPALNAYILGEVMAIIGEDKKPFNTNYNRGMKPDIVTKIENELRQELRNKANKWFGGK